MSKKQIPWTSLDRADAEVATKYAQLLLERAKTECKGPHIFGTACYIALKYLAEEAGTDSREVFLAMARDFGEPPS